MASVSGSEVSDGPVLSLITKKLRALKKKHNRILQLEESQAQGKTLNKEQEDLLKSKDAVSVLIDEYEKLRHPLVSALQEELSRFSPPPPPPPPSPPKESEEKEEEPMNKDSDLEDLIKLLYFGCLFDVKSQSEFTSTLLTRTHERGCCLTYDYVTDDATDLLGENDLDMISALGGLLTSRPVYSGVSHKNALESCIQRAKLWLQKSDEPIIPGASVTYSGLREKLNKILALDYFTMTPEMKLPVDMATAAGKYNSTMQAAEASFVPAQDMHPIDDASLYQHKENEQEEFEVLEGSIDQSSPQEQTVKDDAGEQTPSGDGTTIQQDEERAEADVEHNQRDSEHNEQQQYVPRRGYQNQRSGRGGGGGVGRRGYYSNGRGGRWGRGGGGSGYQNGRGQQYHEPGYYPRNYYNIRGRGGGRSGGSGMYNNNHGAAHGGQVELRANS